MGDLRITLLGRRVMEVLNGKSPINDRESAGIIGGTTHRREVGPGPLVLQGDHGKVSYRDSVLTLAAQ
jgi:hypothetical protein